MLQYPSIQRWYLPILYLGILILSTRPLCASDFMAAPSFSHDPGFYEEGFQLVISHPDSDVIILYTMDGSEPTSERLGEQGNQYQQTYIYEISGITLRDRSGEPNLFSEIPTTGLVYDWLPEWNPPVGEVFKTNVIRARAVRNGGTEKSDITSGTFFVGEGVTQRYKNIAVISLMSDYDYLFSDETGIYVPGQDYKFISGQNFFNDWRYPADIDFFEGTDHGFNGTYEIRMQGNTSQTSPQKAFHVTARSELGDNRIRYPLFQGTEMPARDINIFKRFIIRSWGSARRWPVIFSDAYHQSLLRSADIEIQSYRPAIVFINGEYWGLHEIREHNKNSWYHQFRTGIDRDNPGYDLLDEYNAIDEGDREHWDALMQYINAHDMSEYEHFQYIHDYMDVDNFMLYILHCVHTAKRDWPGHNEAKWRPRTPDGKWRWTQFDMDHGLIHYGRPSVDIFQQVIHGLDGRRPHPLLVTLLENQSFEHRFITMYATLMNSYFRTDVALHLFDSIEAELKPFLPEYQDRWQLNLNWDEGLQRGRGYVSARREYRIAQVLDNFDTDGMYQLTVNTDYDRGYIGINTFDITSNLPGAGEQPYPWSGDYFTGVSMTLHANARKGYYFSHWVGVADSLKYFQEVTVTFAEDREIEAVFIDESEGISKMVMDSHRLSGGDYVFSNWSNDAPPGSYPPNMKFVYMDQDDPPLNANIAGVTAGAYNLDSRTRVNGLGENGVSFLNTSNEEGNPGYPGRKLGGALISLDTRDLDHIHLKFEAATLNEYSRKYNMRLAYRHGNSGRFMHLLDENGDFVEYNSGASGHSASSGWVELPEEHLNQEEVQILFRYFYTGQRHEETGVRTELALRSVQVTGFPDMPPPAKPALHQPRQVHITRADTVEFKWEAHRNASHYDFQLSYDVEFQDIKHQQTVYSAHVTANDLAFGQRYYWRVRGRNDRQTGAWSATRQLQLKYGYTSEVPEEITLLQNYPNPFNPVTQITFGLAEPSEVRLEVFTITGQRVAILANSRLGTGYHTRNFDAADMASGLYMYVLRVDEMVLTRNMMLVR